MKPAVLCDAADHSRKQVWGRKAKRLSSAFYRLVSDNQTAGRAERAQEGFCHLPCILSSLFGGGWLTQNSGESRGSDWERGSTCVCAGAQLLSILYRGGVFHLNRELC